MMTYALSFNENDGHIGGLIPVGDALEQSISLLLTTDRGRYEIFGDGYGVAVDDLCGGRREFAEAELERRISEAVKVSFSDVISLSDVSFTADGETLYISAGFTRTI